MTHRTPRQDVKNEAKSEEVARFHQEDFEAYKRNTEATSVIPFAEGEAILGRGFVSHFGIDCKGLPLHPSHLVAFHASQGNKWPRLADAESHFCCNEEATLGVPSRPALPCGSLPRNVCLHNIGERGVQFRFLQQGLCGLVHTMKPAEAKLAESLFMLSIDRVCEAGNVQIEMRFVLLVNPIFNPEVQSWQIGELADADGSPKAFAGGAEGPIVPFFVRLCSRRSHISDGRALTIDTGDEVAFQLLGATRITAYRLQYEIMKDLRMNRVTGVSRLGELWHEGMRRPFGMAAGSRAGSGSKTMNLGDPFAPRAARGGRAARSRGKGSRGKPPGGRGPPRAGGANGPAEDAHLLPVLEDDIFDFEAGLAEIIAEDGLYGPMQEPAGQDGNGSGDDHDSDCEEYMQELQHAFANDPPEAMPPPVSVEEEVSVATALAEVSASEDESETARLQAPSTSAKTTLATGSSSSSSSPHLVEQRQARDGDIAKATTDNPKDEPPPPTLDYTWSDPAEGGYIVRHGVVIGRLTTWRKNLSIKCAMHGCSLAVSAAVSCEDAARWVAMGQEVPDGMSYQDKKAMRERLKIAHMAVPRPTRR